jgi:hypothetical protein
VFEGYVSLIRPEVKHVASHENNCTRMTLVSDDQPSNKAKELELKEATMIRGGEMTVACRVLQ